MRSFQDLVKSDFQRPDQALKKTEVFKKWEISSARLTVQTGRL